MQHVIVSAALLQLSVFLADNNEGLEHAAALLGGSVAARRARGLVDALSTPRPRLTRRICRELIALHRLLALEDVGTPGHPTAHYFSTIDPADPVVEEICLLTDGLSDCLRALVEEDLVDARDFDVAA